MSKRNKKRKNLNRKAKQNWKKRMNLNYLKKSEELRRYLAENVLHLLSLDFLHVANERPEDQVEDLVDYL